MYIILCQFLILAHVYMYIFVLLFVCIITCVQTHNVCMNNMPLILYH